LESREELAAFLAERRRVLSALLERERADRDREGEQVALKEAA
jgi:dsDNA-binding SOS-regulon protein